MNDSSSLPAPEATTMPFRMLLDEAAKISRRHIRTLFLPMGLFLALVKGLSAVLQVVWLKDYFERLEAGDFAGILPSMGGIGCLSVLVGLLAFFAYAVLWASALDAVAGRPPSLGRRFRWILELRTFGTLLVLAMILLVGFVACFLPGFVVASIFGFAIAAMVEEDRFGTDAFGRSRELTLFNPHRNLFYTPAFKAFVLILVAWMIAYGLSAFIQLPVAIAQQVMVLRDSASGAGFSSVGRGLWLSIPAQIIAGFTTAAVQLYLAMGMALLYFDVRRRRDGWDLEAALDELAPETPAGEEQP